MKTSTDTRALLQMNQPDGFDCPGCAWPDPKHTSSFEFCENGAKAVTWEATVKRVDPDFFARHSASELWSWSDHQLEDAGRLTTPLRYDPQTDHFVPVSWEEAFARAGAVMQALPQADMAEFYCSGRASNEAAFLYQLFARAFGTNNFPDCSNMCHEATSTGLPVSIGIGKGTVTLEDFDDADAIFCIGHNPGTNHPRMLATLAAASKRGAPIIVANPMRERGLERFKSPQHMTEMFSPHATPLASAYHQVGIGGDLAMLKGMMKAVFALEDARGDVLDHDFIARHTEGFAGLKADIEAASWDWIEASSGLSREAIESMAQSMPRPKTSSSAMAWASPSTRTAPRTSRRLPTCCCCAAISGVRARGSARCAATATCRATAPWASPNCPPKPCSPGSTPPLASPRRASMATTRSRR
jgi:molybdopterin-dependent oxidoreductase alpha subunit